MRIFNIILFALVVITSLSCTILLTRSYFRRRIRLLIWSALCFAGLTVSNLFLFADWVIFSTLDLRLPRLIAALIGMLFLLYGFIWDTE